MVARVPNPWPETISPPDVAPQTRSLGSLCAGVIRYIRFKQTSSLCILFARGSHLKPPKNWRRLIRYTTPAILYIFHAIWFLQRFLLDFHSFPECRTGLLPCSLYSITRPWPPQIFRRVWMPNRPNLNTLTSNLNI